MSVQHAVKRSSLVFDSILRPPAGVTILIYHRVDGGSGSAVDLDPEAFELQLTHLAEHHRVVSIDTALTQLRTGDDTPSVVITFDDGAADFTDVAVPALVRHHLPATLYVATQFIDEGVDFPWGAPPTSWGALRDALTTGLVTIGSHTHSHRLLDRLDPDQLDADLDRSIELIGRHLGTEPQHFAYPKAVPGSVTAEIAVRRRFRSAALAGSRVNRPGSFDAHRLWRTPVQRNDGFQYFAAKANGGLRLEGELRALAARLKYRHSQT